MSYERWTPKARYPESVGGRILASFATVEQIHDAVVDIVPAAEPSFADQLRVLADQIDGKL